MKKTYINLMLILAIYSGFGQTGNDGLYFNGVNDNIIVPNTTNINSTTTNDRTYETSFKVIDASSATKQIIMKEGGGTRAVIIYVQSGFLYLGAYNRSDYTPRWEGTFYREAISSNTWYHVALVLDDAQPGNATTNPMTAAANNALKWYLDGALMGEISGYQFGGHNSIRLGYKNETLRFPSCGSWTATGSSEYCFGSLSNDGGSNEYYFNGYIWGFRVWNDVRTITELVDYKTDIITTVGTDDLVAILDGDSFTYLNSSDEPAEAAVSAATTIIWSATAATTDWNTGSNWEGGVIPDSSKKEGAEIQVSTNYPEIGTHIVTGDLKVETGASITVNSGGTLETAYDLTNDGTINVLDGGSLILREKKVTTSAGDFNIQRTTPTYFDNDFYSYWSSPVVIGDSNIATVFPDAELIYKFESSATSSDWVFNGTTDFIPGVGYAVQNEGLGGQLRTFTGNINKGDIEVNIFNTSNTTGEDGNGVEWSESGDNLVGNPYPSAIDWDLVVTDPDNENIEGTVYIWNQNTANNGENNVSDYLVYNLTGGTDNTTGSIIGSTQGFFIKAISEDSDLKITFKTTHQVPGSNTQFYKSNSKSNNNVKKEGRSWFTFNHKDKTNTLLLGFIEGATTKFDRLYDAHFDINQKSLGFYSFTEDDKKTSIQGLPELNNDTEIVKIGYVIEEVGDYSIEIQEEHINEEYFIYLEDLEANTFTNLREQKYNFTINSIEENNDRFRIVYTKQAKETLTIKETVLNDENFSIYVNSSKELQINYSKLDLVEKVSIYNVLGSEIVTFSKNDIKNISNLKTGLYLVNIILQDNEKLTKKILIAN